MEITITLKPGMMEILAPHTILLQIASTKLVINFIRINEASASMKILVVEHKKWFVEYRVELKEFNPMLNEYSEDVLSKYSLKSDGIMSRDVFDWNCIYWRRMIEQAANGEYCELCTDGKEHDFALIVARGHVKKIGGGYKGWILRMYGML